MGIFLQYLEKTPKLKNIPTLLETIVFKEMIFRKSHEQIEIGIGNYPHQFPLEIFCISLLWFSKFKSRTSGYIYLVIHAYFSFQKISRTSIGMDEITPLSLSKLHFWACFDSFHAKL